MKREALLAFQKMTGKRLLCKARYRDKYIVQSTEGKLCVESSLRRGRKGGEDALQTGASGFS